MYMYVCTYYYYYYYYHSTYMQFTTTVAALPLKNHFLNNSPFNQRQKQVSHFYLTKTYKFYQLAL